MGGGSSSSVVAAVVPSVILVPLGVVGLWALATYLTGRHSVENAAYVVLRRLPCGAELRRVPPQLVACAEVPDDEGSLRRAQSRGFRQVAGYIFGGNVGGEGVAAPIAMTAPVVSQPLPGGGARVSFIMPTSKFSSLEQLPQPTSARVTLAALPARLELVEARRGAWRYPELAAVSAAAERLAAAARRDGALEVPADGPNFRVHNYDPPWALPFMCLSEVAIDVTALDGGDGSGGERPRSD